MQRLEACGGIALFAKAGSPLNKVLGLGLDGAVSDGALDAIEAFYARNGGPAQVELCPLAWSDVAARLCARGFVLQAFENQLGAALPVPVPGRPPGAGIRVTEAAAHEDELWTRVAAAGFTAAEEHAGGGPFAPAPGADELYGIMASFRHPRIRRTIAWIEGEIAGTAACWSHEGVLGIFGTSTLPAFRRRGVQAALTTEILDAEGARNDVATATTAPGSTSQRTFERLGFRVLYTRAILVKA